MRADHVVLAVLTPPGIALLYFLLAGEVSGSEAIACAPVVVVAGLYALAMARSGTVELRVAVRGVVSLLRAFAAVVPDGWRVGRGLLKAVWRGDLEGVITHVPLRFGGPGSDDVGRRAAVTAAISLAPNGFAVGMEHERDVLIVHQLVPDTVGGDREWPL